jgi:hypothetical protein
VTPRRPSGAGLKLRVRLSTLLGHDKYPTELAGWEPVPAALARAQALARGQRRFVITDAHGQLLPNSTTHARPPDRPTRTTSCRQVIEPQIPATTLHQLTSSDPTTLHD